MEGLSESTSQKLKTGKVHNDNVLVGVCFLYEEIAKDLYY
jgi:hypothetical protein